MKTGTLYIVSTPIGNLSDMTIRALDTLKKVDFIAAEDTRHASILLKHYSIKTKRISYYKENEERRSKELVEKIKAGENVALISNAGTPAISDPGIKLIRRAIENGIPVVPIPGVSSVLAALVASGLSPDRFCFEGFLPKKKGRRKRLEELRSDPRTLIFFESPYRIVKTLQDLMEFFGDRQCVVAREMTKIYEEFRRGNLSELIQYFSNVKPRGEFVLVVEGKRV